MVFDTQYNTLDSTIDSMVNCIIIKNMGVRHAADICQ